MARTKVRNWQAVHAFNRKAGPHKDRKRELLEEIDEDEAYDEMMERSHRSIERLRRPPPAHQNQRPSPAQRTSESSPRAVASSPQPQS